MKEKLTVIKVGGKIVEEETTLSRFWPTFPLLKDINCWCTVGDVQPPNWLPDWVLKVKW